MSNKMSNKKKQRKKQSSFKVKTPSPASQTSVVDIKNKSQFDQLVLHSGKPSIVDFWADWCGPCKAMAPTYQQVAEQYGEQVNFLKVNTQKVPSLAQAFSIRSIPTMVLLDGGDVVDIAVGAKDRTGLVHLVNKLLKRNSPPEESPGFFSRLKEMAGLRKAC